MNVKNNFNDLLKNLNCDIFFFEVKEMDDNSKKLINQFHLIADKGWIPSINDNWGSVGLTFEHLLDKKADSKYKPDYYDIEIKCSGRYSRYPLFLFTIAFDGPGNDEITRITEKYGYCDKDFPLKKVLFEKVSVDESYFNGRSNTFKLKVERVEKRIYLCVFDIDGNLIEKESYVEFASLKEHLECKLKKMALIYASKRNENKKDFFRYYKIVMYYLRSFDIFIDLVEKGVVDVRIISRLNKSGNDIGRYRNKNLVFSIAKRDINQLFQSYYHYDYDQVYY